MFISPLQRRTFLTPVSAPHFAGKKLVSLDYDNTVTSDPEHVRTAIEDATRDHVILINTQRGLEGMGALGEVLGRNIHYIAGSDGVQFYSNPDTRRTVDSFIRRLSYAKQPDNWLRAQKKATNWDHKEVMKIVDRILKKDAPDLIAKLAPGAESGSQPVVQLKRYMPNEPVFELKAEAKDKDALNACGTELCEKLLQALSAQNIKAKINLQYGSDKTLKYGIVPEGYDKLSPIEYIIKSHPGGIDEVISAGDGMNDIPKLKPKAILGKKNFSLVCGTKPEVKKELGESSHIQYLASQGLNLGTVLRSLIAQPSNIRFKVEQNGSPYRHKISGHEFFHQYHQLNRAQKLKYWEMIQGVIQNKDSTVKIDSRGTTYIFTKRPDGDARIAGMTSESNPLIEVARDTQKWDRRYTNGRFVVVRDLKHNFAQPHFLILPKPLKYGQTGNYSNLAHFLQYATDEQKIGLLDTMAHLVNSAPRGLPNINSLFRINSGRYQEIPYLHIHYTPYQRDYEKPNSK
jgi:hydroxymethylpyrimidine pyrophosphatase-like HAD family hydrolase